MMINIKKGEEYDYFERSVIVRFYQIIKDEIGKYLTKKDNELPGIVGAFALHDVPMKNGDTGHVWIEYNAEIIPGVLVDAGVHKCIIYDGIPDEILDRYNDVKKLIF